MVCEYFCWMLDVPHIFFRQITSFSDSFYYSKKTNRQNIIKRNHIRVHDLLLGTADDSLSGHCGHALTAKDFYHHGSYSTEMKI